LPGKKMIQVAGVLIIPVLIKYLKPFLKEKPGCEVWGKACPDRIRRKFFKIVYISIVPENIAGNMA